MPIDRPIVVNEATKTYDKKITFYDRLYRWSLLILAVVSTTAIIVGVWKVFKVGNQLDDNIRRTQSIIMTNQSSTVEARKANVKRQENIKNYVKCITLARFDNPELVSPTVTKQQVSDALDKCASVE